MYLKSLIILRNFHNFTKIYKCSKYVYWFIMQNGPKVLTYFKFEKKKKLQLRRSFGASKCGFDENSTPDRKFCFDKLKKLVPKIDYRWCSTFKAPKTRKWLKIKKLQTYYFVFLTFAPFISRNIQIVSFHSLKCGSLLWKITCLLSDFKLFTIFWNILGIAPSIGKNFYQYFNFLKQNFLS